MFSCKNLLALLWVCFIAGACHLQKKNTGTGPAAQEEAVGVPAGVDQATYRAAAPRYWELAHTAIDIRFNLAERSAAGSAVITLHPYWYATDSVVLDAQNMIIEEVSGAGQSRLSYHYDTAKLSIRLPKVYHRKDTLQLTIRYKALPYAFAAGGSAAISEDRGLYFVNPDGAEPYQPVQVWTQGETEANSNWFPTFDKSNHRSAYTITMHVPDSFSTLSNGLLVRSVKEKDGMRADTWQQKAPIPAYLVMMAAGNFAVVKESWKGKEVSYYVPREYGAYAKDIFQHTPEMMDFYTRLLRVPYPWDKYSQVVTYDYVSGAMENVSASLFGAFNLKDRRQLDDDNNDYIVAHELFHQWFGDYVTAESWANLTLNESFADYGEYLWSEYKYGKAAAQEVWMQGLSKYLGQARRKDPPLVRFQYASQEDMFDRVSYSKGGLILNYMRALAGDEAFFETLHRYLEQNAMGSAEAAQLRLALEQVTGQDWNWFFNQWYYRGGHPRLELSYAYDDARQQLSVHVLQTQPDSTGLYRLPLKAQLIGGSKATEIDWLVDQKDATLSYNYINGQRPVFVPDAGHWLPGELKDKKSAWQWQQQYLHSDDHLSKKLALTACIALKSNDTAQQIVALALEDKDAVLKVMAINAKALEGKKAITAGWADKLVALAGNDGDTRVRAAALAALGTTGNEQYSSIYELAISDSSYKVAAAALSALDKVSHKRALAYARKLHPDRMKANVLLYAIAEIIAKEGLPADYLFFEQKSLHLFENSRSTFLLSVKEYLAHVKEENIYRKGVTLLQRLATNKADTYSGLFIASLLRSLKSDADREVKRTTDKEAADVAKIRRTIAQEAWEAYKSSIKNEKIKEEALSLEKDQ
jgi:aminopeptidase N